MRVVRGPGGIWGVWLYLGSSMGILGIRGFWDRRGVSVFSRGFRAFAGGGRYVLESAPSPQALNNHRSLLEEGRGGTWEGRHVGGGGLGGYRT